MASAAVSLLSGALLLPLSPPPFAASPPPRLFSSPSPLSLHSARARPTVVCPARAAATSTVDQAAAAAAIATPGTAELTRSSFPKDFLFGGGVSAFQVEGHPNAGGRGNSVWDSFIHIPGHISDGRVNHPSCDFYNRFEEDMQIMKSLGFNAFRFSISWPRIFPNGGQKGDGSHYEAPEGIQFYNNVINSCIRAGITPIVTLFHWETPQYLENDPKILGWRTKNILPSFLELADTCFKHFGDRVKNWVTINEMQVFALMGYATCQQAPGRGTNCPAGGDSSTEPYLVGHHLLLAHAKVYHLYNTRYKEHQKGVVGFNPVHFGAKPFSNKEEDIRATERYLEFRTGWQIDPLVFGDYPQSMKDIIGHRLPTFTKEEKEELKGTLDFLSHNYYSSFYIKSAPKPANPTFVDDGLYETNHQNSNGDYIGPQMGPKGSWIYNVPDGLTELLVWMKKRYNNIPCYIAENGVMDVDTSLNASLNDTQRIEYIKDHLSAVLEAINTHGVKMLGYIYWSYIDNFEWSSGYTSRFGLVRCEFEEGVAPIRTLKNSAKWFKDFLS